MEGDRARIDAWAIRHHNVYNPLVVYSRIYFSVKVVVIILLELAERAERSVSFVDDDELSSHCWSASRRRSPALFSSFLNVICSVQF
jgi:hypothetical protein